MNKTVKTILQILGYIIAAILGRSRRNLNDEVGVNESHSPTP